MSEAASEIARKLRESQERQQQIMQKIAEKEKKMEMQANRISSTTTSSTTSATSVMQGVPPSSTLDSFIASAGTVPASAPSPSALNFGSPNGHHALSRQPSSLGFEPHLTRAQSIDAQRFSSPSRGASHTALEMSLQEDRLNAALLDDDSALVRIKQLSSQLRLCRSESARKDIVIQNLQQSAAELQSLARDFATAKGQWEAQQQAYLNRQHDDQAKIDSLQHSIASLASAETSLRQQQNFSQQQQLQAERKATIQMSELDAQIAQLRAESEQLRTQLKQSEYELAVARRENERLSASYSQFESTTLQVQTQMEDRFFAAKKEHAETQAELERARDRALKLQSELSSAEETADSRARDLEVAHKAKQTQAALIDSLSRELSESQIHSQALSKQLEIIPELRGEIRELQGVREQLRDTQRSLVEAQGELSACRAALDGAKKEITSLNSLAQQYAQHLEETRARYAALTGPGGDLEQLRQQNHELQMSSDAGAQRATRAQQELEHERAKTERLTNELEQLQRHSAVMLNSLQRSLEQAISQQPSHSPSRGDPLLDYASPLKTPAGRSTGSGTPRSPSHYTSLAGTSSTELPEHPSFVLDIVRSAASNLKASIGTAGAETAHLRTQLQGRKEHVEALTSELASKRDRISELESQLQQTELRASHAASDAARELQSREERIGELTASLRATQGELSQQKSDNTALNGQNLALIQALEERLVVVRLWAVEMQGLADSLSASSLSLAGATGTSAGSGADGLLHASEAASSRPVLGAGAGAAMGGHWPSVHSAFSDLLGALSLRCRTLLAELTSAATQRDKHRLHAERLTVEVEQLGQSLKSAAESHRSALATAAQSLRDSERLREDEVARVTAASTAKVQELQNGYERLLAEQQQIAKQSAAENQQLTRLNTNLLAAVRLLYRAFRPLQLRAAELSAHKVILNRLLTIAYREMQQARELREALTTGGSNGPNTGSGYRRGGGGSHLLGGVRSLPHGVARSLFRAGAIAVLAARRLYLGKRHAHAAALGGAAVPGAESLGQHVSVRGESFALLEHLNEHMSNDANIPSIDDSSLATAAQSLVRLLTHFESSGSSGTSSGAQRSLLERVAPFGARSYLASSSRHTAQHEHSDDGSDIGVIRRTCLALAQRSRHLERELQVANTATWAAQKDAANAAKEVADAHEAAVRGLEASLAAEKTRTNHLQQEVDSLRQQVRELEDQLAIMSVERASMVQASELSQMRLSRDEVQARARELETRIAHLEGQLSANLAKHTLELELQAKDRDSRLTTSSARIEELSRENATLQSYLKKKSSELSTMESHLASASDLHNELQRNLQACMQKNEQLIERVRVVEAELLEHRQFSQKLKSVSLQQESAKQLVDLTVSQMQSELREKDRELQKCQELIKTLNAATRAATNELDSQHVFAAKQAQLGIGSGSTTSSLMGARNSGAVSAAAEIAARYGSGSSWSNTSTSNHNSSSSLMSPVRNTTIPLSTASSLHLRHHPGGRLSMDLGGNTQAPSGSALRFDAAAASAPSSAQRGRD